VSSTFDADVEALTKATEPLFVNTHIFFFTAFGEIQYSTQMKRKRERKQEKSLCLGVSVATTILGNANGFTGNIKEPKI